MIKKERKRDKPRIIWVGGIFCVPIAWRIKPKTITILVKEVIIKRIAGAIDRTVKSKSTWRAVEICLGFWASSTPKVTVGRPIARTLSARNITPNIATRRAMQAERDELDRVMAAGPLQ